MLQSSSSQGMATEVRTLENSTNGAYGGQCINPDLNSRLQSDSGHLCSLISEVFYCPLQKINCYDTGDGRLTGGCISQLKFPDLLVTINFTKLHIPAHTRKSMQIMVGLTNDTSKVMLRTSPTTLIPGVNLVGIVNVVIGQVNPRSALTIIGFEVRIRLFSQKVLNGFLAHRFMKPFLSRN